MARFRYGAFHGGPDPLAEPVDAGAAVDALAPADFTPSLDALDALVGGILLR